MKKPKHKLNGNVKCGCGHTAKYHYGGRGMCNKCGCTWFYPTDEYVLLYKKGIRKGGLLP